MISGRPQAEYPRACIHEQRFCRIIALNRFMKCRKTTFSLNLRKLKISKSDGQKPLQTQKARKAVKFPANIRRRKTAFWTRELKIPGSSKQRGDIILTILQFSSVAQSCPTLCDTMDCRTRPPCPSPTLGAYSDSCSLSW